MSQEQRSARVTLNLSPDDLVALDNYQTTFGIDSRGLTALALMRAGLSSVPMNTMVFEVAQAAVSEHRRYFTERTLKFFEELAATMRAR